MRRRWIDRALMVVAALCALCALGFIGFVVLAIAVRGASSLSWGFLTEQIRLVGAAGGIFHNLVGTGILLVTATVVCVPLATAVALVHSVYLRGHCARRWLWRTLCVLNGVPSILFGIVGFIVLVKLLGLGKSWLNGGVLLGAMMLPSVAMTLAARLEAVPRKYVEAAAGLGLGRSGIIRTVLLPQAAGGLLTGTLLALTRAAGETAPILFTATIFSGAGFPTGIRENPVLTLPYHIFILSQDSFDPGVGGKVWATALVLLGLVFSLSLAALPARLRAHEEARHD